MVKGWHGEPHRHGLAARGIPTRIIEPAFQHSELSKYDRSEIFRMVKGTVEFYDWSYFKDAPENQRGWFYRWRIEKVFPGVTYEDFIEFVESGKKMFVLEEFYLVGSREKGYFRKDSDIDFVLRMRLTKDGYDLISKSLDWKDMLVYHIEKIEEDQTTGGDESAFIKNKIGQEISVDAFLSVDMGDYE